MNARRTATAALALIAALATGAVAGACSAPDSRSTARQTGPSPAPVQPADAGPSAGPSASPSASAGGRAGSGGDGMPAVRPGRLTLDRSALRLGLDYTAVLTLRNAGGSPLTWRAAPSTSGLTVSPRTGSLRPGATRRLTVSVHRAPDGPLSAHLAVTSGGLTRRVPVTGTIEPVPLISGVHTVDDVFCVGGTTQARATVVDGQGVGQVTLTYAFFARDGSVYRGGSSPMTRLRGTTTYTAALGPFPGPGTVSYAVHATDVHGAHGHPFGRDGILMDVC